MRRSRFIVWVESRFERVGWGRLPAQTHQHDVDRQSVQPRRKDRFAAEGVNLAQQKQKGFLSEVFRFGRVSYHAQAYGIHTSAMQPVEEFKHGAIAVAGSADGLRFSQRIVGDWRDCRRSPLWDA